MGCPFRRSLVGGHSVRLPHARHCGDLKTSWTEMLLYLLLYLPPERFDPESQCVSDQAFHGRDCATLLETTAPVADEQAAGEAVDVVLGTIRPNA